MVKTRKQSNIAEQPNEEASSNQSNSKQTNAPMQKSLEKKNKKYKKIPKNKSEPSCDQDDIECCECDSSHSPESACDKSNKNQKVQAQYDDNEDDDCPICMVGLSIQLNTFECFTCKKKYHGNCLFQWFSLKDVYNCPTCNCSPFK